MLTCNGSGTAGGNVCPTCRGAGQVLSPKNIDVNIPPGAREGSVIKLPKQGQPGQNGLGSLAQGQIEMSNVNIVDEMVGMITTQRAYETNSKVIQASDQMLQAINNMR